MLHCVHLIAIIVIAMALKELESVKRVQKQQTQTSSATEVRLNRALEEIDKYKQQLQKSKVETKVCLVAFLIIYWNKLHIFAENMETFKVYKLHL